MGKRTKQPLAVALTLSKKSESSRCFDPCKFALEPTWIGFYLSRQERAWFPVATRLVSPQRELEAYPTQPGGDSALPHKHGKTRHMPNKQAMQTHRHSSASHPHRARQYSDGWRNHAAAKLAPVGNADLAWLAKANEVGKLTKQTSLNSFLSKTHVHNI